MAHSDLVRDRDSLFSFGIACPQVFWRSIPNSVRGLVQSSIKVASGRRLQAGGVIRL
jgi:hypothetical protein